VLNFQVQRPVPFERAPEPPARLVLLGHPVAQSLSPVFQSAALSSIGSALTYKAEDVAPEALHALLDTLSTERAGGNVTVPHKEAVFARCVRRTAIAEKVGAVNCFWTQGDGLVGDNTDVAGIRDSLIQLVGPPGPAEFGVRILGAGGSAAATLAALAEWPDAKVSMWARTASRADALRERLRPATTIASTPDESLEKVKLIINTTPVGFDGSLPPVDISRLASGTAVFDLVYAKGETAWVRAARASGLRALDGLRMLVEQGAVSFSRWFGREPDRRVLWQSIGVAPPVPSQPHRWL
jgi:shikimate dehydrogenase